jgi:hypothetical protein
LITLALAVPGRTPETNLIWRPADLLDEPGVEEEVDVANHRADQRLPAGAEERLEFGRVVTSEKEAPTLYLSE